MNQCFIQVKHQCFPAYILLANRRKQSRSIMHLSTRRNRRNNLLLLLWLWLGGSELLGNSFQLSISRLVLAWIDHGLALLLTLLRVSRITFTVDLGDKSLDIIIQGIICLSVVRSCGRSVWLTLIYIAKWLYLHMCDVPKSSSESLFLSFFVVLEVFIGF